MQGISFDVIGDYLPLLMRNMFRKAFKLWQLLSGDVKFFANFEMRIRRSSPRRRVRVSADFCYFARLKLIMQDLVFVQVMINSHFARYLLIEQQCLELAKVSSYSLLMMETYEGTSI